MKTGTWVRANARLLGYIGTALCGVGSLASLFIILVRVPALAGSKMDELYDTLSAQPSRWPS